MKVLLKILKWVGIVVGGLVGLIVIAATVLFFIGGSRINATYDVEVAQVSIPTDEEAVERGRHLVWSVGPLYRVSR